MHRSLGSALASALLVALTTSGCRDKAQRYETTVEILSTRTMGASADKAPSLIEFELRFVDCPGDVQRVVRGDKTVAACTGALKKGEKVKASINFAYDNERENYRGELVRLGPCDIKLDPKEDANFESVQVCKDLVVSGVTVGVHCDKKREGELVAKCPWLKRI